MRWKKRLAQIEALKKKHGRDRSLVRSMPDLSVEQRTAPCGNTIGNGIAKPPMPQDHGLIVDHLHKQGMQVISPSDIEWAGGKKS